MNKYKKAKVGSIFYITPGENIVITLELFVELYGITQKDFPNTDIVKIGIWKAGSLSETFDLFSFQLTDESSNEEYRVFDSFHKMIEYFLS